MSKRELFPSLGLLKYSESGWVTVEVDEALGNYYHYWISRSIHKKLNVPRYGFHITVVAGKYNKVSDHPSWKKYDGERVGFLYDNYVIDDGTTFWLSVISPRLEQIRFELGLPPTPKWPFHITLANLKNL